MKKLFGMVFIVLILSSLVLSACGGASNATVNVDMYEYAFDPATLEVPAGAEVTVNLTNSGTVEHSMVIMVLGSEATAPWDGDDEANAYWEAVLQPGEEETVTFTAPSEPGTYQLVCNIPAHLEQGMVGTLIVK